MAIPRVIAGMRAIDQGCEWVWVGTRGQVLTQEHTDFYVSSDSVSKFSALGNLTGRLEVSRV